jgi:hypothetical protein
VWFLFLHLHGQLLDRLVPWPEYFLLKKLVPASASKEAWQEGRHELASWH